ncbi:carboxymuconolactone decarboxylase family protein, partial [bacterium]|nr:carboxymuconolactone decarboxylase family protein [bacterium]
MDPYSEYLPSRPGKSRPTYLKSSRISPIQEEQWTDEHRHRASKYFPDGLISNGIKTLFYDPEMIDGVMPIQKHIREETSLTPRHRDILILRTAWVLGCEYVWAQQSDMAKKQGLTSIDLRRIAEGPTAKNTKPFEADLINLVDQMICNTYVNENIWKSVASKYDVNQLLDTVATVGASTTLSLMCNALGVQADAAFTEQMPSDIPYLISIPEREPRLKIQRIESVKGIDKIAIKRTWARYPELNKKHTGSKYVMYRANINSRYREILILRTGWNCQAEYEWSRHMGATGHGRKRGLDPCKIAEGSSASVWSDVESELINVSDELYRDSTVSDRTWD